MPCNTYVPGELWEPGETWGTLRPHLDWTQKQHVNICLCTDTQASRFLERLWGKIHSLSWFKVSLSLSLSLSVLSDTQTFSLFCYIFLFWQLPFILSLFLSFEEVLWNLHTWRNRTKGLFSSVSLALLVPQIWPSASRQFLLFHNHFLSKFWEPSSIACWVWILGRSLKSEIRAPWFTSVFHVVFASSLTTHTHHL
jgi:hypothetical protein